MRLSLSLLSFLPATVAIGLLASSSVMAAPPPPASGDDTGHAFGSRFPVATVTITAEGVGHAYGSRFLIVPVRPAAGLDDGYDS